MGIDTKRFKLNGKIMVYRAKKLIRNTIILLFIGLAYAGLSSLTGIGFPCMFRHYTGYFCSGCGISRMCISLLCLDFKSAYRYNQCIFCLIPVFFLIAIANIYKYIKTGKANPGRFQQFIYIIITVILIAFGIIRNLPGFSYLSPPPH